MIRFFKEARKYILPLLDIIQKPPNVCAHYPQSLDIML